jgi:thiol-disulfide isomerase/thioredoxin
MKFSLFFALLFGLAVHAQGDMIKVYMDPPTHDRVVLYAAEGAQQKYITYKDAFDGIFELTLPEKATQGMYRLVYDAKSMNYIDFVYFGKPFEIKFNPEKPEESPKIIGSEENERYFKSLFDISDIQNQLDQLQVAYFQQKDSTQTTQFEKAYDELYKVYITTTSAILEAEKNPKIADFLKAHYRILPEKLIADPLEYLDFVKEHFFDNVNYNNPNLAHSTILADKMMDYVFYLTVAEDVDTQNELYKDAVKEVLNRIEDPVLKKGFIQSLIQSFSQDENVAVVDFIFAEYYDKLPEGLQNKSWRLGMLNELSTAISRTGSDFSFDFNNKNTSLYELDNYEKYILIFWSTSCSHCMKEIPLFYDFIKDNEKIKVIAIGLETEETKTTWKSETYYYPNFIHVLGMGKWENPIARSYNVHATPAYFVLDDKKTIIAKPYDFKAIKEYFEAIDKNE